MVIIKKIRKDGIKQRYHVKGKKRNRYEDFQYKHARNAIKNKREDNQLMASELWRMQDQLKQAPSNKLLNKYQDKVSSFRRRIAENNQVIDLTNKKYFPKNPN